MSYDSPITNNQGSSKISEAFTDETLQVIKNAVGESGINTLRLLMKPIADGIRMNNFILHSDGQINWTGTNIEFNADSRSNHILFSFLMMDENKADGITSAARTIDLKLTGTTVANSATLFKDLTLNPGELIYIELDRDILLNAVSPSPGTAPAQVVIGNNVSSTSLITGARLQKVSLTDTTGMPALLSTETGSTKSQTINIPIAVCYSWNDGFQTFKDIWWIPHGIRWPENTKSVIGAVVVKGLETLPSLFVRSLLELTDAITTLTPIGGIILLQDDIALVSSVTIPPGVTLIARSNLQSGSLNADPSLVINSGASLLLASGSKLTNVNIKGSTGFGSVFTESLVRTTGSNAEIRDCSFKLFNTTGPNPGAVCVQFDGTSNRMYNSKLRVGPTETYRVGIKYNSPTNIDIDSIFDNSAI